MNLRIMHEVSKLAMFGITGEMLMCTIQISETHLLRNKIPFPDMNEIYAPCVIYDLQYLPIIWVNTCLKK